MLSNRFCVIPSAAIMIKFSSLLPVLLLLTSHAQRAGCDMKDSECLDEKQVFFQLRSELRDSKETDPGGAAHPSWRWRRRNHGYHPKGPSTTTTNTTIPPPAPEPAPLAPVCNFLSSGVIQSQNFIPGLGLPLPPNRNTTVLWKVDAQAAAGCCVRDVLGAVGVDVVFTRVSAENVIASLENPNMQSKQLSPVVTIGSPNFLPVPDPSRNQFKFVFDPMNIFPGAVVGGIWTVTFHVADGFGEWAASFFTLSIIVDQCIWRTWVCQERSRKDGCLNVKWVSRKVCLRCVSLRGWYTN